MSRIPDFTTVNLTASSAAAAAIPPARFETPEGIALKSVYTGADIAGLDFVDTLPGIEYARAGVAGGLGIDKFAPRLSFF
ncbi:MAG: hypothetical protein J0J14_18595, partial [Hyphomicrobium sp.]|nr:hypothetical protein [Hyphomicrobium sp.]